MLPLVLTENQVQLLNIGVYLDGNQYRAVLYQDRLYRLVKQFSPADRLQAHVLGCDLAEQDIATIVTAAKEGYTVWIDAKQPNRFPQGRRSPKIGTSEAPV